MNNTSIQHIVKQAMSAHRCGDLSTAKRLYLDILEGSPRHPDALHLYGLACHQQGDHKTAVTYISKAVEQVPSQAALRNNLGDALHKSGNASEAIRQLHIALKLKPGYAGAHQNLCAIYTETRQHKAALEHGEKAIRLDHEKPESWYNLGLALFEQVRLDEAVNAFRQALKLRPRYATAANSLLYILNLISESDTESVCAEHQRVVDGLFEQMCIDPSLKEPPAGRPVRIGYVSADFKAHAVNYFFEPLLAHHTELFETWCYSDVIADDAVTGRLRISADHWRDVAGWSDQRLFEQVKTDQIDVLVDLVGHTQSNRLAVFARKPAYRQVSYLGYPNTSGLKSIDYRIVDPVTMPVGEANFGAEKLLYLAETFACFRPPAHAPAVSVSPFKRNGHVTFGSLHKLEKLNAQVLKTWAEILFANPQSKLLLARDQLDDWHQARLMDVFASHGIASNRLLMRHLNDANESFFGLFSEFDILLDCQPWSGHTLSCCALWMGVPVISRRGNSHAGRMVASVLHQLGLDGLIANERTAYVSVATELCRDEERLLQYRQQLRPRFERSNLCAEAGFAQAFERAILSVL